MLGSNINIMSPGWTDVVFKDRNQAYGAYQLRKENARTTSRAIIIATSVFILVLAMPTIVNAIKGFIPKADPVIKVTDVVLRPPVEIQPQKIKPLLPEKQVRAQHDMIQFPPPVVRPDVEAQKEPPTDQQLIQADPTGPQTLKGDPNAKANIDEPVGPKDIEGVTESDPKQIFNAVEIQPTFPGGEEAFGKFLRDHIRYPAVAKENNVQGRAFLQFVVEVDGSLTDMKIIRDPGSGLGEEAARVLKVSPHWSPGIQNGKKVRVQFTVPVNFTLAD